MNLNTRQHDAITNLLNIAFIQTAKSLSDITGFHVTLEVLNVKMHPLNDLTLQLTSQIKSQEVVTVQQIFSGSLSGTALLLLDYNAAVKITDLVTVGYTPHLYQLDHAGCEVLAEVGNILLNACLSGLGNLLQMHICFSVPRLQQRAKDAIPDCLTIKAIEHPYALSGCIQFRLHNIAIDGYLMLVLEETALAQLLSALNHRAEQPILSSSSASGQK